VIRSLSVKDNLRMFSGRTKDSEAIDMAVSTFPRLGERLAQIAGTLSGGEQQMLALARAYVSGASVILLDEVSMGLAPIVVAEIFAFLDRLSDEGRSLLLVEQYVSKALGLADHVHLLSRGRIVYAGEPAELEGSDIFARYLGSAEQQLTASG
jgi:branched-chain amino acid transport system ATP-binding protein